MANPIADELRSIADQLEQQDEPDRPERVVGSHDYGSREVVIGFDGPADNPLEVYEDGRSVGYIFMNVLAEHVKDQ